MASDPPLLGDFSTVFSIGSGQMWIQIAGMDAERGDFNIRAAGQEDKFREVAIPGRIHGGPFDMRIRWHNSGQLHVWWKGQLVIYRPDWAPGAMLQIDEVAVGDPSGSGAGGMQWIDVTRFSVRLLERDNAVETLSQQFGAPPAGFPLDDPCLVAAIARLQALVALFRKYMADVMGQITHSWQNGAPGQPFSPDAIAAHEASNDAFAAFMLYLARGDELDAERFLARLKEFLTILRRVDPGGFAGAYAKAQRLSRPPDNDPCGPRLDELRAMTDDRLTRMIKICDRAMQVIAEVAGS